jgi:hypothetical protein
MTTLIDHLLAERHRIPNAVIIDCLVLAQLAPSPDRRVPVASLLLTMGFCHRTALSARMGKLSRYGLIEYESGTNAEPGYLITRVGPA